MGFTIAHDCGRGGGPLAPSMGFTNPRPGDRVYHYQGLELT